MFLLFTETNNCFNIMSQAQHQELLNLIEDTVSYFSNEHMIAGETVYKVMECFALAKQQEFAGELQ